MNTLFARRVLNVVQIRVHESKIATQLQSHVHVATDSRRNLLRRKNVLSETLAKGIDQYGIGPKLRALRLRKKMGLVELGQHSGLSPGLLSKIERGRLVPTLPTLLRVALVFSVGLEHFFGEPARKPALAVVRRGERKRFPEKLGDPHPSYHFESLDYPAVDRLMNGYYVEFEPVPKERARRHEHPGAEFIYLMEGRLTVTVADADHELVAGDSMYFDSSVAHSYRREGKKPTRAVVVTTT
jgi:transcriptional regulator with XRE-family HTH domain